MLSRILLVLSCLVATPALSFERSDWIKWDHRHNLKNRISTSTAKGYAHSVEKWSKKYKLDPDWMTCHFSEESHWDTNARDGRSPESWGIPQIQVGTAQFYIPKGHSFTVTPEVLKECPGLAIRLACAHFRHLLNVYHGDYMTATRAYNAGEVAVNTSKRLPGMPHFKKVLGAYEKYKMN